MPSVKGKPKRSTSNGVLPEVLTLLEAAAYLRLPEAEVLRLTREQGLPAQQTGSEWRFLLAAIRGWLSKDKQTKGSNKEAWKKLVGVWKDDPTLDELRKEIEQQRRESASEAEK